MNALNKTYAWRRNFDLEERPVDRNDPEAAATAVALAFPHELSDNAWRMLNYLDDTAFLFAYKGQLVVTDESLDLTECGDGTPESPFGGPRWVGDTGELTRPAQKTGALVYCGRGCVAPRM